ncbi:MAG TPA: hypothetical protein VFP53_03700 [Sphingomicrobium sp.]|nr:hypothetical protein [Sphingomicrobium sp.]
MTKALLLKAALLGAGIAGPATIAAAQMGWMPGSEIAGQTIQVQTNGVMNSIYFGADGTATITTPGGTTVPGTWSAANNQLCLNANGGQECWPYAQPFQSGQQMALTSSCAQMTTFMPGALNPPPAPPMPPPAAGGERG